MRRTPPQQTEFARSLRAGSTDAEAALWRRLRSRQLDGAKFRRQVPMGPYVGDFVCLDAWLLVECDGGQHADSAHDQVRDAWMRAQGWRVLRFWNHEVLLNMEGVLVVIARALGDGSGGRSSSRSADLLPSPLPSPLKGEGVSPAATPGIPPSPSQGGGRGEGDMPAHRHSSSKTASRLPSPLPSPLKGEGVSPTATPGIPPSPSQGEGRGEGEVSPPQQNRKPPPR